MGSQFSSCKNCDAKCCKIVPPMIFEFEKEKFYDKLTTRRFQNKTIFLLRKKGKKCIFLKNNKCQIYAKRPFNCKMFPFDITKINGKYFWIIWDFCIFPKNKEKYLKNFERIVQKMKQKEIDIYILHKSIKKF